MPGWEPGRERLAHVDGLRAVAAGWVMAFHLGFFFSLGPLLAGTPFGPIVQAGGLGVTMFIVISGYCLALSPCRQGRARVAARSFFQRRAVRILPAYLVVTLGLTLLYLVSVFRSQAQQPPGLTDVALHLALVHNLVSGRALRISGPLWSVGMECQLYLAFPLLFKSLRRPAVAAAAVATVVAGWFAAVAALHLDRGMPDAAIVVWQSAVGLAPAFFLGMLVARRAAGGRRSSAAVTVGPALICFVVGVYIGTQSSFAPVVPAYLVAAGTALLLMTRPSGRFVQVLGCKPLAWVGVISYSLYLTHAPIVSLSGKLLGHLSPDQRLVLALLVAGAAVAAAHAFYELVELRLGRAFGRLLGPRELPSQAVVGR